MSLQPAGSGAGVDCESLDRVAARSISCLAAVRDLELAKNAPVVEPRGFSGMVNFIAQDPDQETFVFRKYNRLTAWNLLFMQNELASLEDNLKRLERTLSTDINAVSSRQAWTRFEERSVDDTTVEHEISSLSIQIADKLSRYHSALSSASSIANMKTPSNRVIEGFNKAIKANSIDDDLIGRFIKEDSIRDHDLVSLKPPIDDDYASNVLRDHFPRWLSKDLNTSLAFTPKARYFEDVWIMRSTRALSVLLAVLLIVGSILTLYFVTSDGVRLGLLLMYIVVFAVGVTLTTGAKRDSIFAATAAYAAVLIVFISGDLNKSA